MPQVVSKPKNLPRMSDRKQKQVGRVSCVTRYTSTSDLDHALSTAIGQSDTVSNASGYLSSSSSFETSVAKEREQDSFWDIVTPKLFKSRSDIYMRGENRIRSEDLKCDFFSKDSVQQLKKHDAGSVPNLSTRRANASTASDWKQMPFSTSNPELRSSGNSARSRDSVTSGYQSLPRYRVVVGESNPTTTSSSGKLVNKLSNSSADFTDIVSVDGSMSEFLANVNQDNLASFLNFYDKVTSSAAVEKARRNTKTYESVYYKRSSLV